MRYWPLAPIDVNDKLFDAHALDRARRQRVPTVRTDRWRVAPDRHVRVRCVTDWRPVDWFRRFHLKGAMRCTVLLRFVVTSLLVPCAYALGIAQEWHAPEVSTLAFMHRDGVGATYYRARFGGDTRATRAVAHSRAGAACAEGKHALGAIFPSALPIRIRGDTFHRP